MGGKDGTVQNAIVIKGRLVGPSEVRLDSPVADVSADVDVILRPAAVPSSGESAQPIADFLNGLPPGSRSRNDIDNEVNDERNAWGDRP